MQKRGVKTIEAYPVTTTKEGRKLGSSLAWTGPLKIYEELGFKTVQSINPLRPLVRLESKKETELTGKEMFFAYLRCFHERQ